MLRDFSNSTVQPILRTRSGTLRPAINHIKFQPCWAPIMACNSPWSSQLCHFPVIQPCQFSYLWDFLPRCASNNKYPADLSIATNLGTQSRSCWNRTSCTYWLYRSTCGHVCLGVFPGRMRHSYPSRIDSTSICCPCATRTTMLIWIPIWNNWKQYKATTDTTVCGVIRRNLWNIAQEVCDSRWLSSSAVEETRGFQVAWKRPRCNQAHLSCYCIARLRLR